MNDLLIQTVIFALITSIAVAVAIFYLHKRQGYSLSNRLAELQNLLDTKQNELLLANEYTADIKSRLAAAEASVEHYSHIHERCATLEQQKDSSVLSLSDCKADVSRLNAELDDKNHRLSTLIDESALLNQQIASLQDSCMRLSTEKAELTEKLKTHGETKTELKEMNATLADKDEQISALKSQLSADHVSKQSQQEKIELLERTEKRLLKEFENTANKILIEKTGEMSAQNKSSLDTLLSPLRTQIGNFSKQVNDVYTNEAKERHALQQEVHSLKALNEQMGREAVALTKALKGDNKKQGTWGEVVLERVLNESGLRLNHEYDTQISLKDDEGSSFKPDVIVHLPGNKDVVIDSKMALTAYERYFNADDEMVRAQALKAHVAAIKNHIKQLGDKNYHDLHGIQSLDYVLMFIPVEPAFNLAIETDSELIQLAFDKNIMLVSPTNLMVALKTINNMWRVEYQNQNAQDIAKKAGAIYDKLVGFVDDMNKLGNHMQRAEGSYNEAMKKLSSGSGNLIRRAEQMKALRIGNSKSLPTSLIEQSTSDVITMKL